MFVLDVPAFRNVSLRFASAPDKEELIASIQAAFSLDTEHKSYAPFRTLVQDALEKLRTIQTTESYVLIMSSPYRDDGTWDDENWRAVQIGSYLVNNGRRFRRLPHPGNKHYAAGKLASELLEWLESENWRELFRDINGFDPTERCHPKHFEHYPPREFGLLRNEEGEYLVLGDSVRGNCYGGIYEIIDSRDFEFVGFPDNITGDGFGYEVDERVDQGGPVQWQPLSSWADKTLEAWSSLTRYEEAWDARLRRQELWRLEAALIEIPDIIRAKARQHLTLGDLFSAEAVVLAGLGPESWAAVRAWMATISGGLAVYEGSPGYLKDACASVRSGHPHAASKSLMDGAGLTEREARNWIECYYDYMAVIGASHRGGIGGAIGRAFSWRRD